MNSRKRKFEIEPEAPLPLRMVSIGALASSHELMCTKQVTNRMAVREIFELT